MKTKLSQMRDHAAAGEWRQALKIAATFRTLGPDREAIQRGWAAETNPAIYREMNQDPAALVAVGMEAMKRRYKLG